MVTKWDDVIKHFQDKPNIGSCLVGMLHLYVNVANQSVWHMED